MKKALPGREKSDWIDRTRERHIQRANQPWIRAGSHPSLFLCRNHRCTELRLDGPSFLSPAGRLTTWPHHLRHGGRRSIGFGARTQAWYWYRVVCAREVHHCLGREYPREQRTPVAFYRRGPAQRRQARGDRSIQDPHSAVRRLVLAH